MDVATPTTLPLWWYGCAHTHNIWHARFPSWSMGVLTPMMFSQVPYSFVLYLLFYLFTKACHFWRTHMVILSWQSHEFHGDGMKIGQVTIMYMKVWVISYNIWGSLKFWSSMRTATNTSATMCLLLDKTLPSTKVTLYSSCNTVPLSYPHPEPEA